MTPNAFTEVLNVYFVDNTNPYASEGKKILVKDYSNITESTKFDIRVLDYFDFFQKSGEYQVLVCRGECSFNEGKTNAIVFNLKRLCEDSETSQDLFVKGTINYNGQTFVDECVNFDQLNEYNCVNIGGVGSVVFDCSNGCADGACQILKIDPTTQTGPIEIPAENTDLNQRELSSNPSSYLCNGCEADKKCYPLGYRKNDSFCGEELSFVIQKETDRDCKNSFECKSNVCASDKCISGDLFSVMINFFKNLFGMN